MAPNNLLDRLVAFEPTPFPVVSVYLNTQPDQNGRDNFEAFVRRELKARAKSWTMRTPERESFDRDAERINGYLRDELRPSSNGAAPSLLRTSSVRPSVMWTPTTMLSPHSTMTT